MKRWEAIVPLRGIGPSKTRLLGTGMALGAGRALAFGFTRDVVSILELHPLIDRVTVLTGHEPTCEALRTSEIEATLERFPSDLNASIADLSRSLRKQEPDRNHAVVMADLPALRLSDVDLVLQKAATVPKSVVGDREGQGSCFLSVAAPLVLEPRFGPGSLTEHESNGYTRLEVPSARTIYSDVDTLEDLHYAADLGLGPFTTAVIEGLKPMVKVLRRPDR